MIGEEEGEKTPQASYILLHPFPPYPPHPPHQIALHAPPLAQRLGRPPPRMHVEDQNAKYRKSGIESMK